MIRTRRLVLSVAAVMVVACSSGNSSNSSNDGGAGDAGMSGPTEAGAPNDAAPASTSASSDGGAITDASAVDGASSGTNDGSADGSATPITVPAPTGLALTNFSLSPASPKAGDALRFTAVVENPGAASTSSRALITVAFSVDGTKVSAATSDGSALAAGATLTLTASATWPATAGEHTLSAIVDGDGALAESFTVTGTGPAFTTSDALLNLGTAASVMYNAPGSSSALAQVAAKSDASDVLWKLFPDAYDATSGSGSIDMVYNGTGSIVSTVSLSGLNAAPVSAYPLIGYGGDVFGFVSNGQPPQFPATIASMTSLTFDTHYSIEGTLTNTGLVDVLFDEFLMPTSTYSGGQSGAIECEILPYYDSTAPLFGTFVKTFNIATVVDGASTMTSFVEYESVANPGVGSDILFYPASLPGFASGEISFDALAFLEEAAAVTNVPSSWYVDGYDLGTELGQNATESFTFTATKVGITQVLAN